jgi:methylmalonyl-CoA mutase C-terminal domain/subunit
MEGKMRKIRVLLTKIGLDGHDRGVKVVATALREAGMEVIYTGPWQTIETVVETALQEDVDVIGISSLAYDHLLVPKLMKSLREKKLEGPMVIVGGVIPEEDISLLEKSGVAAVFPAGTPLEQITQFIKTHLP